MGSSNWSEFTKLFFEVGYAVKYVVLDAARWVPQRRRRVYILLIRWAFFGLRFEEAVALLGQMLETAKSLAFDEPIAWTNIMLAAKHQRTKAELKELMEIAAKRKHDKADVMWPDKLLTEMTKAGISYSSLQQSPLWKNPWFKTMLPREQMTLLKTLAEAPCAETIDTSQTITRIPKSSVASSSSAGQVGEDDTDEGGVHLCSTLLTGSGIWKKTESRLFLGWEACSLQCIPCAALPGSMQMSRRLLCYIAGDAFCGAAFSAVVIGIFTNLPDIPLSPDFRTTRT